MRIWATFVLAGGLVQALAAMAPAASFSDSPPPGGYCPLRPQAHKNAPTFRYGRPIVGATYFYWYDIYSGAHIRNPDGSDAMTTHPPEASMADLSYRSPAWHYSQLRDMAEAGLDFFMPVYWGMPGQYGESSLQGWSFTGLPPLIEAHDRMLAEHKKDPSVPAPPMIGLFYDTSTLQFNALPDGRRNVQIDLTTPEGRDWFYTSIRDFFSMIPPAKWARVDGKPIIFLYCAGFASAVDDKLFGEARRRFKADFGSDFLLIRHADWPGQADGWYIWSGALGLKVGDIVAALGPGYDHSAVPGRQPLVVHRRSGGFYKEQWEQLLRMQPIRRPWMVHVETWNEWHEGTDIARSQEWGVRYIEMTARYARLFREGVRLPRTGQYVNAERVRWTGQELGGLTLLPSSADGYWQLRDLDARQVAVTTAAPGVPHGRYLYFDIDDSFMFDEMSRAAEVTVVFRDDGGCDSLRIDYDNGDPQAGPAGGAFRPSREIPVRRTGSWRTVTLQLPDVRFCNRANRADFRLAAIGGKEELAVCEVLVRKLPGKSAPVPTTQSLAK